jgi:hypothetical protein
VSDRPWFNFLLVAGTALTVGLVLGRNLGSRALEPSPPSIPDALTGESQFASQVTIDSGLVKRTFKPDRLYLPTYIEKIGDRYFIVDCYNNRVLYSSYLSAPLHDWQIPDDSLSRPHSIASDGRYFVVDNTDAHEIKVYQRHRGGFLLTQTVRNIGARPHRVRYDPYTSAFYIRASESQAITKLVAEDNGLVEKHTKKLPFLGQSYTRSFGIVDHKMIFVSGPRMLTVADYVDSSYEVLYSLHVPAPYQSMNDILRVGGAYYITVTNNIIIRCDSLLDLPEDKCQSVYDQMSFRGNPYYFSRFDGHVFVSELTGRDDILMFDVNDTRLVFKRALFTDR